LTTAVANAVGPAGVCGVRAALVVRILHCRDQGAAPRLLPGLLLGASHAAALASALAADAVRARAGAALGARGASLAVRLLVPADIGRAVRLRRALRVVGAGRFASVDAAGMLATRHGLLNAALTLPVAGARRRELALRARGSSAQLIGAVIPARALAVAGAVVAARLGAARLAIVVRVHARDHGSAGAVRLTGERLRAGFTGAAASGGAAHLVATIARRALGALAARQAGALVTSQGRYFTCGTTSRVVRRLAARASGVVRSTALGRRATPGCRATPGRRAALRRCTALASAGSVTSRAARELALSASAAGKEPRSCGIFQTPPPKRFDRPRHHLHLAPRLARCRADFQTQTTSAAPSNSRELQGLARERETKLPNASPGRNADFSRAPAEHNHSYTTSQRPRGPSAITRQSSKFAF
jgi:hypothetical protein